MITPTQFDHHNPVYAVDEDSMTDFEGSLIEKRHKIHILLSEIEEDPIITGLSQISRI